MKINVYDVLKENGAWLDLELSEELENNDFVDNDIIFRTPVGFTGRIANINGVLKLTGRLKVGYKTRCLRCLKEIECKLNIGIEENFVKAGDEKDDDTYTYEGNYVELDKPIKDNILLSLPMKHVCSDACRGICPKCGCNLNKEQCECKEEQKDPRMEVLKDFFDNSRGNNKG
ncbi:MAG: YceD family protein [Acetivibrionales bacterium]